MPTRILTVSGPAATSDLRFSFRWNDGRQVTVARWPADFTVEVDLPDLNYDWVEWRNRWYQNLGLTWSFANKETDIIAGTNITVTPTPAGPVITGTGGGGGGSGLTQAQVLGRTL